MRFHDCHHAFNHTTKKYFARQEIVIRATFGPSETELSFISIEHFFFFMLIKKREREKIICHFSFTRDKWSTRSCEISDHGLQACSEGAALNGSARQFYKLPKNWQKTAGGAENNLFAYLDTFLLQYALFQFIFRGKLPVDSRVVKIGQRFRQKT